ncbi:NAD(P)-binding protein [Zopfia rhizophila CBS 207.26]|uniref:NAD(P)-binding protein n=1 Tax=Zopfia rhizophila CBS 207.26 TaxID=1314779 RepID=A0A6A6E9B1_9PEZI|nr:NAD(P)-binding protein [Zopfia rhizophila CBS 207.26]
MTSPFPATAEATMPKTPAIDWTSALDTSILKDKSVIVTGGSSGIGLASVEKLASLGAIVSILDVQIEAETAAANDLSSKGHKVQFVQCDVSKYESQVAAFKSAIEFGGGKIDLVVAAAGIVAEKNLFEMAAQSEPSLDIPPPEPGLGGVDVNLKGVYYSCYLALHYFRLPPPANTTPFKKAIVLIASIAGYIGYPESTTYSMSKFGVRGLLHIRINLVAPWFIKTSMTMGLREQMNHFGFAPIENVIDAVLRLGADEKVTGRAAIIMPEGNSDLGDDVWDGLAGPTVQKVLGERMGNMMKAMAAAQQAQQ